MNYLCGVQPLVGKKLHEQDEDGRPLASKKQQQQNSKYIEWLLLDAVVKAVEDSAEPFGQNRVSLRAAWQAVCDGLDNMFYVGEGVFVQDAAASAEKSMTVSKLHLEKNPRTLEVNELPKGKEMKFSQLRRVTQHSVDLLRALLDVEGGVTDALLEVDGRGRVQKPGLELIGALRNKGVNVLKHKREGLNAKCKASHEFIHAVGPAKGTKLAELEAAEWASLLERLRLANQVGATASTFKPENYHEPGDMAYYFRSEHGSGKKVTNNRMDLTQINGRKERIRQYDKQW